MKIEATVEEYEQLRLEQVSLKGTIKAWNIERNFLQNQLGDLSTGSTRYQHLRGQILALDRKRTEKDAELSKINLKIDLIHRSWNASGATRPPSAPPAPAQAAPPPAPAAPNPQIEYLKLLDVKIRNSDLKIRVRMAAALEFANIAMSMLRKP